MMRELLEFIDKLVHADSVADVLAENKKQAVKTAAIAVGILLIILLYLHQGSEELTVSDAASAGGTKETRTGQEEGGPADGEGTEATDSGLPLDTDGIVYVDIGGAVKEPMLAELPSGSRVEDAIRAAGGLTGKADMSGVNRAQILTDGEKVYIPEKGEGNTPGSAGGDSDNAGAGSGAAGISSGRININTADAVLLQQLTGVGPVTAQKIVDYREQNGKFRSIEDLKNVSGIGDKTFEKMRDDVTI